MRAWRSLSTATLGLAMTGGTIALAPADGRAAGAGEIFVELPAGAADLDAYRWERRPVLVFAPSRSDPAYVEQRAMLEAAAAGLAERDVVVLSDTSATADGALRRALDPQGFEVLLIGKDGGVKLRERRPVSAAALFGAIDAMPMRRREAGDPAANGG